MESIEICQFLEWDSDFFQRRIARATVARLDPDAMAAIFQWCQGQQIECLYFLADPTDIQTARLVANHDFNFVDIRVTLEKSMSGYQSNEDAQFPLLLRAHGAEDIPRLMEIASGSFQLSRFYFDENFSEEECDAMYQIWVQKSCQGYTDSVIVAEQDGQALGFITCSLENEDAGSIGLVGVAENSRGIGVGGALISAALQWFADQSVESIHVVTQGRNIPALRLYQRHGFLIKSVQIWYHKWFSIIEHPKSL